MPIYHDDPDLIWIQDVTGEYGPSRTTLDKLIAEGMLHPVTFVADKRFYLRRSELDRVLGKPIQDVPESGSNAG